MSILNRRVLELAQQDLRTADAYLLATNTQLDEIIARVATVTAQRDAAVATDATQAARMAVLAARIFDSIATPAEIAEFEAGNVETSSSEQLDRQLARLVDDQANMTKNRNRAREQMRYKREMYRLAKTLPKDP